MDIIQEIDEDDYNTDEALGKEENAKEKLKKAEGGRQIQKVVDAELLEIEKSHLSNNEIALLEKQVKKVIGQDCLFEEIVAGEEFSIKSEEFGKEVESAPEIKEEVLSEEPEVARFDRNAYLTEYRELLKKSADLEILNSLLQVLVIRELSRQSAHPSEVIASDNPNNPAMISRHEKYVERLEIYINEKQEDAEIRFKWESELKSTRKELQKRVNLCEHEMKNFCEREAQIGQHLISSRTGRLIPEKHIARLLNKQIQNWRKLASSRVTFFRNRDRTSAMEELVAKRETIAEGLTVSLYETMTLAKVTLCDKIEERDQELAVLRDRCRRHMLVTAHLREKTCVIVFDTETSKGELKKLQTIYKIIRGRVVNLHHKRVEIRKKMEAIRNRAGLLMRKPLLHDYASCVSKVEELKIQLEFVKKDFVEGRDQLRIIRSAQIAKSSQARKSRVTNRSQVNCSMQHITALKLPPITTRPLGR